MLPKGKFLALVAIFLAIGGIAATGAFTTVAADRTASVDVAGDSGALLGIEGADSIDEGAVTETDGVAEIDLSDGSISNAGGINPDARTVITPLVNVTNNGNNAVDVTINVTGVTTGSGAALDQTDITIVDASGNNIDDVTQSNVGSGETVQFGLELDLTGYDQSDFNNDDMDIDIEILAEES